MKRFEYRWVLLALLSLTFFLELGTRQIYNVVLPLIRADFLPLGVSDVQLGMVGTVFTMVFGFSLVASGFLADLISRKWVLTLGTLLFSLGISGCGLATGLAALVVCYGVVNGFGQCCVAPACLSLISQHHVGTRATAMSVFNAGNYVGVIVCCFVSGWIGGLGAGAWRWAFWIFGGIGVVWALVLMLRVKDEPSSSDEAKPILRDAVRSVVGTPSALLMALAFAMLVYGMMGFNLWAPTYMLKVFPSLTPAQIGFHAVFWLYGGCFAGVFTGARIADRLARGRRAVRIDGAIVSLVFSAITVFALAHAHSLAAFLALMFAHGFARGLWDANFYPGLYDFIAPRYRSSATGLIGSAAFVIGSFAPMALGWMSEHVSLATGIASLAGFFAFGAAVLALLRFLTFERDVLKELCA